MSNHTVASHHDEKRITAREGSVPIMKRHVVARESDTVAVEDRILMMLGLTLIMHNEGATQKRVGRAHPGLQGILIRGG